ncbi:MAG: hypothetical protein ACETVY_00280, partial [Candidatus Bathyarchaeia archaeon]
MSRFRLPDSRSTLLISPVESYILASQSAEVTTENWTYSGLSPMLLRVKGKDIVSLGEARRLITEADNLKAYWR